MGSLKSPVNWVARSEARRACEVSIALDLKSTPIAIALSVPPGPLVYSSLPLALEKL